ITAPFTQALALEPSCSATINGNLAIGRPGIRLAAMEQAFGDHGAFETVCQGDYTGALAHFAHSMSTMMSPCLEGNLATADRDPANPGVQLDCMVTDRGPGNVAIPACAMLDATTPDPVGARPCFWTDVEPS